MTHHVQSASEEAIVRSLVRQFAQVKPTLRNRAVAAGKLVLDGSVLPTELAHTYRVASRTNEGHTYLVNGTCECMDTSAPLGLCAHRLAARLSEKLSTIQQQHCDAVLAVQVAEADLYLAQGVLGAALSRLQAIVLEHRHYEMEDCDGEVSPHSTHSE